MICSRCGTENRAERKFCLRCGNSLQAGCPNCGASNEPDAAFCGECGSGLARIVSAPLARAEPDRLDEARSERRLVSILFADHVGFTTLTEGVDAEDARELLNRYFEVSREVIERYGGSIEKFIGDAVMAVWGTPVAHEDDAERAVRAALDLVAAVSTLGDGLRLGALAARGGVMTGEAAVTLGASGQGMVAGDLVNTASRLQSVAPPGTVLVDEATYRAASSGVAFEPAGEQVLRGKVAPVAAWRPTAVVGKVRGSGRPDRIEPPFVGREVEFQLLKDQVHATTREGRARLVSLVGVGGIGKSRLAWELEKYLDGVVELVFWHRGRSPAYGDGVSFWALGEMVRRRAGVAETDDEATTLDKLDACLAEFLPDTEERRWIAPRLCALLGLEPSPPGERDELFAAWRRFFERIAARATTVLVFEDLHWADPGLFDFIESLLEWSRNHPILIVTLARAEVFDRRATWGAGQRNFTAVHLEPLPSGTIGQLVRGLAPTLPEALVRRIVERAEGIPLYAVETIRMLVDAGHVVPTPDGFGPVGEVPSLMIPDSLHALIAARLDALDPADRAIVQMASVLGLTFTLDALAAVSGEPLASLEPRMRRLLRREFLELDVDPRSPERGQYRFVQSLIREVAYSTLARRDRRSRHLAAARHFEALGDDELAGILATHYLEAYRSSPPGPEADAVAVQARIALEAAATRARGLGSPEQALGFLELATQVATDDAERARLWTASAEAAHTALRYDVAMTLVRRAISAFEALDDRRGVARASALLGQILMFDSRIEPAVAALKTALAALPDPDADRDGVDLLALLARAEMFQNRSREALELTERGLEAAAALDLVAETADLLITRAWALSNLGRTRESVATLQGAIEMAREHGLTMEHQRGANNLATLWGEYAPRRALEVLAPAVELAERLGHREWIAKLGFRAWIAIYACDWDLAAAIVEAQLRDDLPLLTWGSLAAAQAVLIAWREDPPLTEPLITEIRRRSAGGTDQDRFAVAWAVFEVGLSTGDLDLLTEGATSQLDLGRAFGDPAPGWYRSGVLAALLEDADRAREALAGLDEARAWSDTVLGHRRHIGAIVAALEGRPGEAAAAFREASEILRRTGAWWSEVWNQLDCAVLLGPDDPAGRAAIDAVRKWSEELRAPALARRLDARLARRADRALGSGARPRDQARAPQNVRTTS